MSQIETLLGSMKDVAQKLGQGDTNLGAGRFRYYFMQDYVSSDSLISMTNFRPITYFVSYDAAHTALFKVLNALGFVAPYDSNNVYISPDAFSLGRASSTFVHELGHVLDFRGVMTTKELTDFLQANGGANERTFYSDPEEDLAESWASFIKDVALATIQPDGQLVYGPSLLQLNYPVHYDFFVHKVQGWASGGGWRQPYTYERFLAAYGYIPEENWPCELPYCTSAELALLKTYPYKPLNELSC